MNDRVKAARRFALAGGLGLALAAGAAEEGEPGSRVALEKWVETRRLASRERQEWRAGKVLLEERIELLRREAAALAESTAQVNGSLGEADRKLADSAARIAELKEAVQGLGGDIARLEARVQALLAAAPAPIVERVKPLSQRLPAPGAATRLGLSERFQNVVGILNELNKFSREISVTSEVRDLQGGAKAEVSVLYVGLAAAYYCNPASGVAGVGRPTPAGWVWEPANGLAQTVADAIAIHRNEKPAGYVLLPAKVEGP
jgi:hypothetical protein